MIKSKIILAIETSCDETAVSIISSKITNNGILSSINIYAHVVESQNESHAPFGGVVPEVAARDHLSKIYDITQTALTQAKINIKNIDALAVTMGPGLIGALMVGVLFARGLASSLFVPLISVNHVDAHLAPALLIEKFSPSNDLNTWLPVRNIEYPALALTVSGGHCHLSLLQSATERILLGKSLDDACGEAFDKVAKLLGLGYPGGPLIETLAHNAETRETSAQQSFAFPAKPSNKENRYNFTYSGLKTAVMEAIRKETGIKKGKITGQNLPQHTKENLAFAFQNAALHQLYDRVLNAIHDYPDIKTVLVAGGVAQNKKFRQIFSQLKKDVIFSPPSLCSDNATMIGLQALLKDNNLGFTEHPFSKY
jgi:N6-L-threonylcarbamoyladenine synthase